LNSRVKPAAVAKYPVDVTAQSVTVAVIGIFFVPVSFYVVEKLASVFGTCESRAK